MGTDTHPFYSDGVQLADKLRDMRLGRMQTFTDDVVQENTTESQAKRDLFEKLSQIEESDHSEIKHVKSKIAELISQEMGELGFRKQLSEEEASALTNTVSET
jgi:hypothetical protein